MFTLHALSSHCAHVLHVAGSLVSLLIQQNNKAAPWALTLALSLQVAGSLVSLLVQQNSKAARVNATAVPGALTATAGVPPFTAPAHSVGAGRGEGTVQPARPHGLAGADLAAGLNGAAELSQAVAGGMRLTLTQEVRGVPDALPLLLLFQLALPKSVCDTTQVSFRATFLCKKDF